MQLGFVATPNAVVFALHFSVGNSLSDVGNENELLFSDSSVRSFLISKEKVELGRRQDSYYNWPGQYRWLRPCQLAS
jgi:hypothetical protein